MYGRGLKLRESLYCLQSQKITNKTNSTTPVIKNLLYLMPRALAKKCGKLISIKLVLRNICAKAMKVN